MQDCRALLTPFINTLACSTPHATIDPPSGLSSTRSGNYSEDNRRSSLARDRARKDARNARERNRKARRAETEAARLAQARFELLNTDGEDNGHLQDDYDTPDGGDSSEEGADGPSLPHDSRNEDRPTENPAVMTDEFDTIDVGDAPEALSKLGSIKVPWDHRDVAYWSFELELQMTIFNVGSQWVKRIILANNLPPEVRGELKELLKQTKAQVTADKTKIYKELKTTVLELHGKKDDQAFEEACNLNLTTKPSALCKNLYEILCQCKKTLDGCCQAKTVLGLWKRKLPQQVRSAIAEKSLAIPEQLRAVCRFYVGNDKTMSF